MAGLGEALTSKPKATNSVTVLENIFRLVYATSVAQDSQLENKISSAFITTSINIVARVIYAQKEKLRSASRLSARLWIAKPCCWCSVADLEHAILALFPR